MMLVKERETEEDHTLAVVLFSLLLCLNLSVAGDALNFKEPARRSFPRLLSKGPSSEAG